MDDSLYWARHRALEIALQLEHRGDPKKLVEYARIIEAFAIDKKDHRDVD